MMTSELFSFITLVVSVCQSYTNNVPVGYQDFRICNSLACNEIANHLLDSINISADPCENFYEFSCGRWISENEIPDVYSGYSIHMEVEETVVADIIELLEQKSENDAQPFSVQLAKLFYKICLNETTYNISNKQNLLNVFDVYGDWPILNASFDERNFDVTLLLAQLVKDFGDDYFVNLIINPDVKGKKVYALMIEQMGLAFGDETRDYYLNETKYNLQMAAYKELIIDIVQTVADDSNITVFDHNQVDEIIDFEKTLANIIVPREKRRNQTLFYNRWSISKLSETVPFINWTLFFATIAPNEVLDIFKEPNFTFIVTTPDYLHNLQRVLNATSKRTITNYIYWRFVYNHAPMLDYRFIEAVTKFQMVFSGKMKNGDRFGFCYSKVTGAFPIATGAMYIRKHFSAKSKLVASSMITIVKENFKQIINNTDWMDPSTKMFAMDKVDSMKRFIGYPEFMKNDTSLDEEYEHLTFNENDSFFVISQKIYSWVLRESLTYIQKPVDINGFEMSPAEVNAYYVNEGNLLRFPAGYLQYPYFNVYFPKYINFGSTGSIIGHEIAHGFDDEGSQYDKNGNLNNWWSDYSRQKFTDKTKCLIDQFNKYYIPLAKLNIKGEQTLNENIADLGGIKTAFKAYQNYKSYFGHNENRLPGLQNFTDEQMFFISFAHRYCEKRKPASMVKQVLTDGHSPNMFRVNGVVINMEEFASAFNCPKGSKMNPDPVISQKCSVW